MSSTSRITIHPTPPTGANADSQRRHFLGLWHLDINDSTDLLGCVWREPGEWQVRLRFRHDYGYPVLYETRYQRSKGLQSEGDVRSFLDTAYHAANSLHRPITYEPIEGGCQKAMKVVFGNPGLVHWAMDDPALPVVRETAVDRVNATFLAACASDSAGNQENPAAIEFEPLLAASAELPVWHPNELGFWGLDLIGVGPIGGEVDATTHGKILERRAQWVAWAQSLGAREGNRCRHRMASDASSHIGF